jgi:hypothetical protein
MNQSRSFIRDFRKIDLRRKTIKREPNEPKSSLKKKNPIGFIDFAMELNCIGSIAHNSLTSDENLLDFFRLAKIIEQTEHGKNRAYWPFGRR